MRPTYVVQLCIYFTLSLPCIAGSVFDISLNEFNSRTCVVQSKRSTQFLSSLKVLDYHQAIESYGHDHLLAELWDLKIKVHESLRSFHSDDTLLKECADEMRGFLFELRNSEDIIENDLYRIKKDASSYPEDAFVKNNTNVRRHPNFKKIDLLRDLKSGDIILSRGKAFTSAAISSLGEFDTQFSHLSVVYKDDNGKFWTVESHIEVGAFVRPIEDHINDKNFRTMIFRFDDELLAQKAAEYIYFKVKKASDTTGNIFYDFAFDQESSTSLFCSEIASHAFEHVSQNSVKLPMFRSQLQARKPSFVQKLGIKSLSSFIPSDIEVDPRFKVLAEWKNAALIADNLEKDAVLRAMYKWSDDYGYELVQGKGKAFVYRNVAWPLRRVPFLKKYFKEKLPINMSRDLIGYFGVLESTGELLQNKLKTKEKLALESRGMPLLNSEKFEILEDFREQDYQSRSSKLHRMFRPISGK